MSRLFFCVESCPENGHSYGIQVARLAGLPEEVLLRAREILNNLEKGEFEERGQPRLARSRKPRQAPAEPQLPLFSCSDDPLRTALQELDIANLTPLEGLNLLHELQRWCNPMLFSRNGFVFLWLILFLLPAALCHAGADGSYRQTRQQYDSLVASQKKQLYRDNWEQVIKRFDGFARAYPEHSKAPAAIYLAGKASQAPLYHLPQVGGCRGGGQLL
ncbi:MAG: hypothetical protein R2864_04765 [Syntrophotaleaceae bacterium]